MPKYSGTVRWKTSASRTPARPAYMEDRTNTPARYLATGTPITPAAIRWSRMALSARPGLPRSTPRAKSPPARRAARPRYQSFSDDWKGTAATTTSASSKVNPKSERGGTGRPLKPPVSEPALNSTCWPMKISARVAIPR